MATIRQRAIFKKGTEIAGAFNYFPSDTPADAVVDMLRAGLEASGKIDSSWELDSLNGVPVYHDADSGLMIPIGDGTWTQK